MNLNGRLFGGKNGRERDKEWQWEVNKTKAHYMHTLKCHNVAHYVVQ
jgi:hypothetical protein